MVADTEKQESLNVVDLLRYVVFTLLSIPPNHWWQIFLETKFPAYAPAENPKDISEGGDDSINQDYDGDMSNSVQETQSFLINRPTQTYKTLIWKHLALKLFLDCLTLGVSINTVAFIVFMGLMKGKTMSEIGGSLKNGTISLIVASYKVWPVAAVVGFCFVPVERRLVYFSAIGAVWGVYLSIVGLEL
jgi:hypothetical protein